MRDGTRRRGSPPRRGDGFTLIELMMVLTILGVTAAIVSMNFASGVERLEYDSLVRSTLALLGRARTAAIVHNAVQVVECDFTAQRITRKARTVVTEGGPRVEERAVETLSLPAKVVRLVEWSESPKGDDGRWSTPRRGKREYVFLPDGLGDAYAPLKLGLLHGPRLAGLRRTSRGRVELALGAATQSLGALFGEGTR